MGNSSSLEERILENKFVNKAANLFSLNRLIWLFICIGIFIRFTQYLLNHSLWIDESFVALNILDRSYLELFKPLEYNQGAPIGFLLAVKFATQIFGDSEYSLRLFPFLSGIFSIFLFYKIARWFGTLTTTAIAVGLFALCDRLIYYSAELKQYSSDVFIGLLLYFLAIQQLGKRITYIKLITFAVVGAIAIWFSHPSVFILAGIGITLLISAWVKKEWSKFSKYIAVSFAWLASFIAFYLVSIRELSNNAALQKSWDSNHNSFMPLPPVNLNELKWYFEKFFEIFNYPSGLYLTGIAAIAFIIGCQSIFSSNKQKFYLLISPVLFTLLASGLHKYPFKGQLLLFIIPSILLIVASGTQEIIQKTYSNFKIFSIGFVCLLFLHPFYYVALSLNAPQIPPNFEYQRIREDIKPVLNYVEENQKPGDIIYVYYASQYAFKYYLNRYNFDYNPENKVKNEIPQDWFKPALPSYPPQIIVGKYSRDDWSIFEREIEDLIGNERVWFIFSHAHDRRSSLDEEDAFLYLIDRKGKKLDSYKSTEASAYLYDLSENSNAENNL